LLHNISTDTAGDITVGAMAAQVPASLKAADIGRYALRASQLEQAKPVIAYWCNYWIAQQIIAKNLYSADEAATRYTTDLMDKLEKFKNEHITDETVTDDVAGKAVVEQFGLETFARADNAVRANMASRQTADTFQASATFLELLAIWGPIEAEFQQKIKYGKFHALRIAKALRAGEDPNLSNPEPEPKPEDLAPPLDPNDPEVLALNGGSGQHRQPSVVDAPDESGSLQTNLAAQSYLDESIHPSRAPSVPPLTEPNTSQAASAGVSPLPKDAVNFYTNNANDVSPVSPDRKSSVGGNYFPSMPSPTSSQAQPSLPPTLPSAPDTLDDSLPGLDLPSAPVGDASAPSDLTLPSAPDDSGLPSTPTTFAPPRPVAPRAPLDSFQAPPTPGQPPIAPIAPNSTQTPFGQTRHLPTTLFAFHSRH